MTEPINAAPPESKQLDFELKLVTDPAQSFGFQAGTEPLTLFICNKQVVGAFIDPRLAAVFFAGPALARALDNLLATLHAPPSGMQKTNARNAAQEAIAVLQGIAAVQQRELPRVIVKEPPKLIVPGGR